MDGRVGDGKSDAGRAHQIPLQREEFFPFPGYNGLAGPSTGRWGGVVAGSMEDSREALLQGIAGLYAHGEVSEETMEGLVSRVSVVSSAEELRALAAELPPAVLASDFFLVDGLSGAPAQELSVRSGSVRRAGRWLRSKRLRIAGASSSFRLDLRDYAGLRGLELELELELKSSSLRVLLPPGFAVVEDLAENRSSVVRVKEPRRPVPTENTLVLKGRATSSSVKVKVKR